MKEQEARKASFKLGYFMGGYDLRLIEVLEWYGDFSRDEIEPELYQKLSELDALMTKEDLTVADVDKMLMVIIREYAGKLRELKAKLNYILETGE